MSTLKKELKYIKIYNDISENIKTYKLTVGMQLLGVRELMDYYGASYSTVMKALRRLEEDDHIETVQGKGIFVKNTVFDDSSRENNLIGLIVTDMNIPFFSKIIQVIEGELVSRGYDVIIRNSDFNSMIEQDIIATFIERGVRGIIMVPTFDELDSEYLVSVDTKQVDIMYIIRKKHSYACNYVIPDDYSGGLQATEYLVSHGHRAIGYISGAPIRKNDRRFDAFSNVLHQHGIDFHPEWVLYGDQFEFACGYNSMKQILALEEKPTALVCYTDSIAVGAMKACREAGYSVPHDFSIVGYNNENITDLIEPSITTIENPISEICRLAVSTLVNRMQDNSLKHSISQTILPTRLIEKHSVRMLNT